MVNKRNDGSIKIVEKHANALRTEYRGEYGYLWLSSVAFPDAKVASFQAAFDLLETRFPDTFLAPVILDINNRYFGIQVIDKKNGEEVGEFNVTANGSIDKKVLPPRG